MDFIILLTAVFSEFFLENRLKISFLCVGPPVKNLFLFLKNIDVFV
ncbi:hypothetical protein SAMN05444408_10410 [Chryseobacterium takakiae]|uniref:Uncharacterized protein n=1 Tax=Chryseobacterium takakiae TaxID=1302685 RepID=A0A1M4W5S5_9FLAO|nr:hypothetical protein SAMN05444408_10410 [Chryseobacterium takakiae]